MAHFILEYSANLDPAALDFQRLFATLHEAAAGTGLFPLAGIRSRAIGCEPFRVADGNPDHAFVHLAVKIGAGRTEQERAQAARIFFEVLSAHLDAEYQRRGLAISFELLELPAVLKYNRNNLREHLARTPTPVEG